MADRNRALMGELVLVWDKPGISAAGAAIAGMRAEFGGDEGLAGTCKPGWRRP